MGHGPRALPRPREDDRRRLPRRPPRHAVARSGAGRDRDGDAHNRSLRARPRHACTLCIHRPRAAVSVAQPRLGRSGRRNRFRSRLRHRRGHAHDHSHGHHHHEHDAPSRRSLIAVGITGGLLPCPSALVVLLAAISLHRVAFGMLLIVAFSAGLALSITGIGLVAVFAKQIFKRASFNGPLVRLLPAASALVILAAGLAMTVRALPKVS
ncbi:MAG: hypothetical protein E6G36_12755 [Actinobacteria bacterium]|nr:MAG: hypothetical protein E6G36_12755 [Actinomycetota bacterium]